MSIKIQSMVWDRYPGNDHELLLALKLADYCDDNGEHIFPSIETMATKCRRSERAIQYQIQDMVKSGWLVLVANAGGGRGRACEYRINEDWINGATLAPISAGKKGAKVASIKKGAMVSVKGATDDTKGATDDSKGCNGLHPTHQEPPEEPSGNHQPARRAPRVALHNEILNLELPDTVPFDSWDAWCEHREAKAKGNDAPWTMAAAKVSIKKLGQLAAAGQPASITIDEAVLRGWTGLFPINASSLPAAGGSAPAVDDEWSLSMDGIKRKGNTLGVKPHQEGEIFMRYKARVFKAAGPGPWMEKMLAENAKSEDVYNQLFAYFNDVRTEPVPA